MKKLLTTFLFLFSINGYCEWVEITSSNSSTVYVEPSSIKKIGKNVRLWTLYNFSKSLYFEKVGSYKSFKSYDEYDCVEEKSKNLSILFYSDEMGEGNNIFTNNKGGDWNYQPPSSVGLSILKMSCGLK